MKINKQFWNEIKPKWTMNCNKSLPKKDLSIDTKEDLKKIDKKTIKDPLDFLNSDLDFDI